MKSDTRINELQVVKNIAENIVMNQKRNRRGDDLDIATEALVILLSLLKPIDKKRLAMFLESEDNFLRNLFGQFGTLLDRLGKPRGATELLVNCYLTEDSLWQIVDLINCSNPEERLLEYCGRDGKKYVFMMLVIVNFLIAEVKENNGSSTEKLIYMYMISAFYNLVGIWLHAYGFQHGLEDSKNQQKMVSVCSKQR